MNPSDSDPAERGYDIGYRKPPRATRFAKGKSGNPAGRPKKGKSLSELLEAEFDNTVYLTEKGKRRKVSARQAVVKQLVNRALTGDAKARDQFIKLMAMHDAKKAESTPLASSPSPTIVARVRFLLALARGLIERGILKEEGHGFVLNPEEFAKEHGDSLNALNDELRPFDVFF